MTVASDMAENFNPRPRKEGDAPASVNVAFAENFNPRPRKEGDCYNLLNQQKKKVFQSTPS